MHGIPRYKKYKFVGACNIINIQQLKDGILGNLKIDISSESHGYLQDKPLH